MYIGMSISMLNNNSRASPNSNNVHTIIVLVPLLREQTAKYPHRFSSSFCFVPPHYSRCFHDAVLIYAAALNMAVAAGGNVTTDNAVAVNELLNNVTYNLTGTNKFPVSNNNSNKTADSTRTNNISTCYPLFCL